MIPSPLPALALALALAAPSGLARAEPGSTWGVAQLGWGDGGWTIGGTATRFSEALAHDPLRISAALEACRELRPHLLPGVRLSALHLGSAEAGAHTRLVLSRLEAVASWRPFHFGPYARLGSGPALLWYDTHVPGLASGRLTQGGWSLSAAAGAFWPASPRLELRLEAEASAAVWAGSRDEPRLSWVFGGSAGVAWR